MADLQGILMQLAQSVSGYNPGALHVCMDLAKNYGDAPLRALQDARITGPEVWLLYKDVFGEDYGRMVESLMDGTAISALKNCRSSSFYTTGAN